MCKETPVRILVVEDDRTDLKKLVTHLKKINCEVVGIADNGHDAFLIAEQELPDIALMDIKIKGNIDGIETAQLISEHFAIPVIYITNSADNETISRAAATYPYGYLNKPVTDNELYAVIKITMEKHRHQIEKELSHRENLHLHITEHLMNHTFNQLDMGLCFCDKQLNIHYKNTKSDELIGAIDSLSIHNGRIKFHDSEKQQHITRYIHNNIDMIFNISNSLDMLITISNKQEKQLENKNIILFILQRAERQKHINTMLSGLYGLTNKEVKIVQQLITSGNLRKVAEALNISYDTVRYHMKNIHSKTNTDSLHTLIKTLTTGPAGLLFKQNDVIN